MSNVAETCPATCPNSKLTLFEWKVIVSGSETFSWTEFLCFSHLIRYPSPCQLNTTQRRRYQSGLMQCIHCYFRNPKIIKLLQSRYLYHPNPSNSASRGGIPCVIHTHLIRRWAGWIYFLWFLCLVHCVIVGSCHVIFLSSFTFHRGFTGFAPFLYISFHSFSTVSHWVRGVSHNHIIHLSFSRFPVLYIISKGFCSLVY